MNIQPISDSEISALKVSSLPTRPTAPAAFGGRGYTASEMKAAFDMLPLFIIERLNALIAYLKSEPDDYSVARDILTGLSEGHTLYDLFGEIREGSLGDRLSVLGEALPSALTDIRLELADLDKKIESATGEIDNLLLDAGGPADMLEVEEGGSEE